MALFGAEQEQAERASPVRDKRHGSPGNYDTTEVFSLTGW